MKEYIRKNATTIKAVIITVIVMSVLGGLLIYDVTRPKIVVEPSFHGSYILDTMRGDVLNINEEENEYSSYVQSQPKFMQTTGDFKKLNDRVILFTTGELEGSIVFLREGGIEYYGKMLWDSETKLYSLDKDSSQIVIFTGE